MSLYDKIKNLAAGAAVAGALLFGAPAIGNATAATTLTRRSNPSYSQDYLTRGLPLPEQKAHSPTRWGTRSDIDWDLVWLNPHYLRDAHFKLIPDFPDRLDLVGEVQSSKGEIAPRMGMQYFHRFDDSAIYLLTSTKLRGEPDFEITASLTSRKRVKSIDLTARLDLVIEREMGGDMFLLQKLKLGADLGEGWTLSVISTNTYSERELGISGWIFIGNYQ